VSLHWTLYMACDGNAHPLRATTTNISSDGFYCLVDQPVRTGDVFECDIVVPAHSPLSPDDVVYLRCHAQAVRVEKAGSGSEYGIACRIENYHLIRGKNRLLWAQGSAAVDPIEQTEPPTSRS
jgi:hypothetical protein